MGPKTSPPKSPTDHEDAQNDAAVPTDNGAFRCSQKVAHGREQDDGIEIAVHDVEGPTQDKHRPGHATGRASARDTISVQAWMGGRQQRPQG